MVTQMCNISTWTRASKIGGVGGGGGGGGWWWVVVGGGGWWRVVVGGGGGGGGGWWWWWVVGMGTGALFYFRWVVVGGGGGVLTKPAPPFTLPLSAPTLPPSHPSEVKKSTCPHTQHPSPRPKLCHHLDPTPSLVWVG